MRATYKKTFNSFVEKFNLNKSKIGIIELFNYPFDELELVHKHAKTSLNPWSDRYASPLNHINLYEVTSLKQILGYPYVLVRDGFFTLIDFFWRFPEPKKIETILLINKEFGEYIPEPWRKYVLFYNFEFRDAGQDDEAKKLLVVKGLIVEGAYDLERCKVEITSLFKKTKLSEYIFCLHPRQNNFLFKDWRGDDDFVSSIKGIISHVILESKKCNIEARFVTWKEFFLGANYNNGFFIDINKNLSLYSDDYTDFFLSGRGAKPFEFECVDVFSKNDCVVKLNHLLRLRIHSEVKKYQDGFQEIRLGLINLGFAESEELNPEGFYYLMDVVNKRQLTKKYYVSNN